MGFFASIAADAAHFSFRSGDQAPAASVETPFHRLVVLVEDEGGNVLRSIEHFADGRVDVRGEGEASHQASGPKDAAEPEHDEAHDAESGDDKASDEHADGDGFAAFSQHADEAQAEGEAH